MAARIRIFLTLERPRDRTISALTLVVLTLISPNVGLPGSLPAIRLEQIVLILLLPLLVAYMRRHPEVRRIGTLDLAFLGLGAATTATIILAPVMVAGVTRSYHDVFEIVRIGEYWLVYRLGTTLVPPELSASSLGRCLAVAAIPLGLLAAVQFIGPPGFNEIITAFWTETHNLAGVTTEGRAVGTAGNANQFGILAVLFLTVGLAALSSTVGMSRRLMWASIVAAVAGLLLTQSRGALLAAGVAMFFGLALLLVQRRARRALVRAVPPLLLGFTLTLVLVIGSAPSGGVSVLSRYDLLTLARDPSLIIRLGRVQSLFTGPAQLPVSGQSDPAPCVNALFDPTPDDGHAPGMAPPDPAPSQTTSDVQAMALATSRFYCDTGQWPGGSATDLVPKYLTALPTDPATGQPYAVYTSPRGYAVESPSAANNGTEPAGFGSLPNLLVNPSFETGDDSPSQWIAGPGSTLVRDQANAAFGDWAADASMPGGGSVYQYVVIDLPMNTPYNASIWARAPAGAGAKVQLYVVAITASGQRLDPIAETTAAVAGDEQWHELSTSFVTPDQHLTSIQFLVRAPGPAAHVSLDGAVVAEGPGGRAFETIHDAPASQESGLGPSFLDSPIIGVGPQKDAQVSTFDNEYADFLQHYGVLGLLAYGLLLAAAFWTAVRRSFERGTWAGTLGLSMAPFVAALAAFAITAGAYRQLQVMVIFWILVGLLATAWTPSVNPPDGQRASTEPSTLP